MVGPAKTLFMDEISTGLDSSTTYLIVRCIKNYVHLLKVSSSLWGAVSKKTLAGAGLCQAGFCATLATVETVSA
jgi:hypothetical protein